MENKKRICLLGAGEIGSAVKKIAEEAGFKVLVRELAYDELDGKSVAALHVCIPYQRENFVDSISKAAQSCPPAVIIIHSTVPPGVTKAVAEVTKLPAVHSPVRGDHPDLYHSIKDRFVKYIGGVDQMSADLAARHLKALKIKNVRIVGTSLDAELGKIVNILGYTWSIIFCKWVLEMCEDLGGDFDIVYNEFTKSYNDGYKKFRPNVIQPILKPIPGHIGGHCVIPDTVLLQNVYKNKIADFILKQNESYKKDKIGKDSA